MLTANIHCITRLRIHSDGEGVRSVIFMQGCPLNCLWCCNPETRFSDQFRTLTPNALYQYIKGDIPYFLYSRGGVTFSGGEPLFQADFILSFIKKYCRKFSVDIETSLHAPQAVIEKLIPYINVWNVDCKIFDESLHKEYTGVSNALIQKNLKFLSERIPPSRIIATIPMIPGYNTDSAQLLETIQFLKKLGIFQVELHPYRKIAEEKHLECGRSMPDIPQVSENKLHEIRTLFEENGFSVLARYTIYDKEKCAYLKNIRKTICEEYKLPVHIAECTVTEECIGTCPVCEQELFDIAGFLHKIRKIR